MTGEVPTADIVLVLEGTYPFVLGGVSSWVHRLITRMPELSFGVVHLAPRVGHYGERPAYQLPPNVAFVQQLGIVPPPLPARLPGRRLRAKVAALWDELLRLRDGDQLALAELPSLAAELRAAGVQAHDLLASQACWEAAMRCYRAEAWRESFLNFHWTWRFAWQPLLELLLFPMPEGGVYHTVSTGYAGMLAALAAASRGKPLLLTEHGIYTKERRIEIYSAHWIRDVDDGDLAVAGRAPYFREFWQRHFALLSRCCYEAATRIVTLYDNNRQAQIADGAPPAKCQVVPNGVDVQALTAAAQRAQPGTDARPFTVAFVGRVCPIKDVRTFLAAMRLVAEAVPDVVVRVLGPMNEDAEYAEGCRTLARELGLAAQVRFEGPVDVRAELPHVDVLVLTSISEAQPLVVLEAGAFGVPVVASDVGSCRELLEGRGKEDKALGIGGLLTPIASPGAVAAAVLRLHADPELRRRMGESLQRRVQANYDEVDMIATYRGFYEEALATAPTVRT